MPYPRKASICIPTHNGADTIGRCLRAALSQTCSIPYDIVVVDTESSDGTPELVASFPVRLRRIHKDEFDHGDTRNLAASLCDGEALIFLTQDAVPADDQWLQALLDELRDDRVAGSYSRNLPHPGSAPLVMLSLQRNPAGSAERRDQGLHNGELASMDPTSKRLLFDFNNVSSCIRRSLWERFPFPRTKFGEDVLWARGAIEAGYRIVYTPRSRVFHGHDDPPPIAAERAEIDGKFNAEYLGRKCIRSLPDAVRLGLRISWKEHKALKRLPIPRSEKWRERLRSPRLRLSETVGLWRGGRTRRRVPRAVMLDQQRLRVLYVAHGFPPESFAGTEVYTREIAREMSARGHMVGVFYRSVAPDVPDLALRESESEGLKLYRIGHALGFHHAGESYAHSAIEARFREVCDRFRPDVVHFQHLIHLSAKLIPIARERGSATVATLHDYWSICPRVQCFRPDGTLCQGRQELGCLLCLKGKHLKTIEWVAGATRAFRPLVEALIRRYEGKLHAGRDLARRQRDMVAIYRRDRAVIDAFSAADLLISPSRFLRDLVLKQVPEIDPHRLIFSDNGMRMDGLHALSKKPDPLGRIRFGFVGSLVSYKGAHVAIEAMNLLEDPRAVLRIYGGFKPDTDPYHARLRELAKKGNVEFMGAFDHARLSEVLAEVDALIVPSTWYENAPLTIREAHLTGTPTIVSNLGGMAESVRPGRDGLHFEAGNARDLAGVLLRLVSDPSRLAQLHDFVERKTIRENAAELEFRYRALVAQRKAISFRTVAEFRGSQFAQSRGSVEQQGEGMALLRPGAGGSSAEYRFRVDVPGDALLRVEYLVLAGERDVPVGGAVELNGELVDEVAVEMAVDPRDTVHEWTGRVRLRSGRNELRLSNRLADGREVFLRVRRVVIRREGALEEALR